MLFSVEKCFQECCFSAISVRKISATGEQNYSKAIINRNAGTNNPAASWQPHKLSSRIKFSGP